MAWSSLASNQMVSFTDAQGGGFALQSGQSNVNSNQCMTKSEALAKYVLNASNMSSYASNQLVPKSTWVSGVVGNAFTFGPDDFASSGEACANPNTGLTLYSADTTLSVNSLLYSDIGLSIPYIPGELAWYHGGSYVFYLFQDLSGTAKIGTKILCASGNAFSFGPIDSGSSAGACSDANTGRTLYSDSTTLTVGTHLYTDQYLTNSFIPGDGSQSYYLHSGSDSYRVTQSGIIDLITACSTGIAFSRDSTGYLSKTTSCANAVFNSTFYGVDDQFVVGDTVYEDSSSSLPFDGQSLWWAIINGNGVGGTVQESIRINSLGIIIGRGAC